MSTTSLLADIGGTHARFALAHDGVPGEPVVVVTADFADLSAALDHALAALGAPRLDGAAVCAAGPPADGVIHLTNCPWQVSAAAIARRVGAGPVVLVNDYTALAAALTALAPAQLRAVGGGSADPLSPRAVIGAGTGLGVSACVPAPAGEVHLCGEGGHVSLAAASAEEDRILARLRKRFGHVSAERVLSGDGLTNLYRAMHPGAPPPPRGEAVAASAAAGDLRARACVSQFCAWLGAVAGDLALTFGARGGVYLGGGIVPGWGPLFDAGAFRDRFEAKGRYRGYLSAIPVWIITAPHPAFVGLARLLAARLPPPR